MNSKYLVVFCTCPDRDTANTLARAVVGEKLAACINIVPGLASVFRWAGVVQEENEVLLVAKLAARGYERLQRRLLELHPYDVPEIIALELATGSHDYLNWLDEQTEQ